MFVVSNTQEGTFFPPFFSLWQYIGDARLHHTPPSPALRKMQYTFHLVTLTSISAVYSHLRIYSSSLLTLPLPESLFPGWDTRDILKGVSQVWWGTSKIPDVFVENVFHIFIEVLNILLKSFWSHLYFFFLEVIPSNTRFVNSCFE